MGLLAVQACVRIALAVKSAAMPDVLSGKDLLQGNGLSQAGGALAQIFGIVFGGALAGFVPPFVPVVVGAGVLVVGAFVATRLRHAELRPHDTTFGQEASKVVRNIVAGLKEVAGRAPAALGLSSFQMLRYQFWGFGLFVFGLYAKNLVADGDSDTLSLALSGLGGLVGGALGMIVAQKYKDRVAPVRLLLGSMVLLGVGTIVGGAFVSVAGFAAMLFIGFFSFFVGQDLGRHDHAADDARRFPRPGVRPVRHRLQPRLHRAGGDPVPRCGRRAARPRPDRSCSFRVCCSSASRRSSPRGRAASGISSRRRTISSRSTGRW